MNFSRPLTLLMLACALALRLAVPGGWMPVGNGHGGLILKPCPSAAPVVSDHGGHHGKPDKKDHDGKSSGDCAFAPLQAGLDLWPAFFELITPASISDLYAVRALDLYYPTGPPAPPPPSTGPPFFA